MYLEQHIVAGDNTDIRVIAVVLLRHGGSLSCFFILLGFLLIIPFLPHFPLVPISFVVVVSIPLVLLSD